MNIEDFEKIPLRIIRRQTIEIKNKIELIFAYLIKKINFLLRKICFLPGKRVANSHIRIWNRIK